MHKQMIQRALLRALVVILLFVGVAASDDASFIEKQFARLDSSLTRLSARPEVRMKEVAPFDGVAKQMLAAYPEIEAVMRTNSKGSVVNSVRRENGDSETHADVSEWYAATKSGMVPYYGQLRKENGRTYCIWTRPLSIGTLIGGRRFGGVVATSLDITACFSRFTAAMHGPFEILLDGKSFYYISWNEGQAFDETPIAVPGHPHFAIRVPRMNRSGSSIGNTVSQTQEDSARVLNVKRTFREIPHGPAVSDKQKPLVENEYAAGESLDGQGESHGIVPGRAGERSLPAFFKIAIAVAALIVVFCLWLIISTLRTRQSMCPSTTHDVEQANATPLARAENAAAPVENEDVEPAQQRPSYAHVPALEPATDASLSVGAGTPENDVAAPVPPGEPAVELEMSPSLMQSGPAEIPIENNDDLREAAARRERDETAAEMRAEMPAKITDDMRNEIYEKELEIVTSAIRQRLMDTEMAGLVEKLRQQFARELHQHIAETMAASIEEQERRVVEKEAAKKIRDEEYEAIVRSEREKLSESVRTKLAEEESVVYVAEARESLRNEIYSKVRAGEEDVFSAQAREELAAEIRKSLIETEKEGIASLQRQKLESELYDDVSRQHRETIRESIIKDVTNEERKRIESGLRKTILEDEKNRIIAEEAPGIRQEIRTRLRDEELDALHGRVRDEIYSETVQAIKQNLEDKYRVVVEEKIAQLHVHLEKKARSDIRAAIKGDYDRLMERLEQLSGSLTNIEVLQSLSQTVTLLTDEKKKYKYLNLNAAQTESLLEYLKRVHNRFNIFFDRVDESIRELTLGLGSVGNKLDRNE
jgi:hypothetical protein